MNRPNFEQILRDKRAELTSETVSRDEIAVERLPDAIDDVQQAGDRDLAIATLNRHWKTIAAIDEALGRIEDGTFGECFECEEKISERRLQALPWAAHCLRCQEIKDAQEAHDPFFARAA